jgi:hypothetical protein
MCEALLRFVRHMKLLRWSSTINVVRRDMTFIRQIDAMPACACIWRITGGKYDFFEIQFFSSTVAPERCP